MEVKELRIGNLVTDEWYDEFSEPYRNIITVDSINEKGIDLFVKDDGNWSEIAQTWVDADLPIESLRGIPLNEKWLLKLGLKKGDRSNHLFGIGNLAIMIPCNLHEPGVVYFNNCIIIKRMPQYVHQLQNLYFALTGEELTTA